ncbi:MAG: tetratricopeptide repeat protein [Bacteroidetes bacterium]|nr:tetratricopeptide repeat protein [Bacteroidota bacterium]
MNYLFFTIISLFVLKIKAQSPQKEDKATIISQIKDNKGIEKAQSLNKAAAFLKLNKPDSALTLAQQALAICYNINNENVLAESYGNIAECYGYLAKHDSAIHYYIKALAIAEQLNSRKKMASYYNGLGTTLYQLGDFEKAISYMKKASTIKLEDKDFLYYAVINGNIAATLQRLSKFKEAIKILKDSEKALLQFNNIELLANLYNSLGTAYLFESNIRNLDSSIFYFNKNIQLISLPEHDAYRLAAYVNLGDVFIEKKEYNEAEIELNKALGLSLKLSRNQERVHIYESLSKLNENQADYKQALFYKNLQNALNDSLVIAEKTEIINNMESQHQIEKKDLTIKQQEFAIERERYKSRLFIFILLFIAVLASTIIYILFLRKKTREIIEIEKTRFFSNVVHEFRTPLTLLKGPLEEIKKKNKDFEQKENIRLIERSSDRLLSLVNQLLDVSKIEAGKYILTKQYGAIETFLIELIQPFQKLASEKGITFQSNIKLSSDNYLFASDAIEKIITNILSNAIKYTYQGGEVSIEATIDSTLNLNIRIIDTGTGISKKDLPNVFDRFYQSKNANRVGGTGLGLSLTKELINLLKGNILIQSELNKGTEVNFSIPLERQITNESINVNIENDLPQIVLVEDDIELAKFTANLLKAKNYLVHVFNNGTDGLTAITEIVPDIIITDIMMPGLDGLELSDAIKKNSITAHIPIIGLSAKSSQNSKLDALHKGIDLYITKPFHPDELILQVNNFLQTIERNQELYKKHTKESESPYNERLSGNDAYLLKIITTVEKNIDNSDFSVNELSDAMFISRSQLHRKIKSLTGFSTTHFIRIIRLEKAKDMLKTNQGNVTEVAYSCGFTSQSYFTKSFTEYFGVSPSNFLK